MTKNNQATTDDTEPQSLLASYGGWQPLLAAVTEGRHLSRAQAEAAMAEIFSGRATPIQIAALLVGLKTKGETIEELTGFAAAMLAASDPLSVDPDAIDIVGTGGSQHRVHHALNVSTMASIVASSAGAVVCKHGNRKASSTSGSFDFLEALGVHIDLGPRQLEACVAEVGLGFAFARNFHPAMRFAGPVRVELGIPTVFNILGPLANPARVTRQVVGVSSPERAEAMSQVLQALGSKSAWVVAGAGGLDELSTTGTSVVYEVSPQDIVRREIGVESLGMSTASLESLAGGSADDNVQIFNRILSGEPGPHTDIVLLNSAAGLVVAGKVASLSEGLESAMAAIKDGRATAKLDQLRTVTNRLTSVG